MKDISDMLKDPPSFIDFNPIMFALHLPISLHKEGQEAPDRAEIEDFVVVYDGRIIMVTAVCSLDKRPYGVYDVRDRLSEMMKSMVPKFQTTSPCLTHQAIVYVNDPERVDKNPYDIYLKIEPKENIFDTLRNLYMRLNPDIMFFYSACAITEKATELVWDIDEYQGKLLSSLKEFLAITWRHPLKRTKIVGQIKMCAIEILERLSRYSSLRRALKEERSHIEERRAHNSLFNSFIEKIHLDEYTTTEAVDTESLMRIIENARSETETYSSFISTFVSTLVGAIIGSALTIIISYILGFL